jgi:hypothetical protein
MGVFLFTPDFCPGRFNVSPKPGFFAVAVAFVLSVCVAGADAQLVINEIYYDHPGSDTGYEFIELMNVSGAGVALAVVTIEFHNGSGEGWEVIWTGGAGVLPGGELYAVGGALVRPPPGAVSGFSLQNGPDAIRVTVDGEPADLVAYGGLDDGAYAEGVSAPGVDAGLSLVRIPDGHDSGDNAADLAPAGPSPGAFNVARHDAAVGASGATRGGAVLGIDGRELLTLIVTNGGQHDIGPGLAAVDLRDSTVAGSSFLERSINDSEIVPGGEFEFTVSVILSPGYHWLVADVDFLGDERPANNRVVLVRRVGGPALLVSEVLCYPAGDCPQFVELFNAGTDVDISGFKLRDRSHSPAVVTTRSVTIPAHGYAVITPDAGALEACFPGARNGIIVEHGGTWPTFNRTGSGGVSDSVIFTDALTLPVDAVAYPPVGTDHVGRSLERVDLFPGRVTQTWVLSRDPSGASPGRPNERSLFAPPVSGDVDVTPRTFSPFDGETLTVSVDAEPGMMVAVTVYDVEGRRVTALGSASAFPAVFVWDGRGDGGRGLLPGLYIVVCEMFASDGSRSASRKTVVGCGRRGE